MIGKTFSKWFVIDFSGTNKHSKREYLCRCECGITKTIVGGDLRSGKSTQCTNCYNKIKYKNKRTHGKTATSIYRIWALMKERCLKAYNKDYKYYGARGITICEPWLQFNNFYIDMGDRPDGMQLDRIDNNQGYYKENCRWVTPKENSANRRKKGTCFEHRN